MAIRPASTKSSNGTPLLEVFSYPLYVRLRDHNTVFTGLLASGGPAKFEVDEGSGASEPVRAGLVSGNYFDVLGVPAALGRTFTPGDESSPGAAPFVVISDAYWSSHFARAATLSAALFASMVMPLQSWESGPAGSPAKRPALPRPLDSPLHGSSGESRRFPPQR